MASLVVTTNSQTLEGGRVAYGQGTFRGRRGEYQTYMVRLSAKASAFVEEGDALEWWDCGPSQLPYIPCGGQIIKKDGRKVQLTGDRDCGIGTGHPPQLHLKMVQKLGLRLAPVFNDPIELPFCAVLYGGKWYQTSRETPIGGLTNGMSWQQMGLVEWEPPQAPRGYKLSLTEVGDMQDRDGVTFTRHYVTWKRKQICLIDSDQPLIK